MFKVGDKVVCLTSSVYINRMIKGNIYKIHHIKYDLSKKPMYMVESIVAYFHENIFILLSDYRKQKIENIKRIINEKR